MRLPQFSLANTLAIIAAGGIAVMGLVIIATLTLLIEPGVDRQALTRQSISMAVAWHILHDIGSGVTVDGDQLRIGDTVLNGNTDIVDNIQAETGGVATIFKGDIRIATNIYDDSGRRTTGTSLESKDIRDIVLELGRSYTGKTDIQGKSYYVDYEPLRDMHGEIVGILFVGLPHDIIYAPIEEALKMVIMWIAICSIVFGVLGFFIPYFLLKPLTQLRATVTALGRGEMPDLLSPSKRSDEIGEMTRSVILLQQSLRESKLHRQDMQSIHQAWPASRLTG